MKALLMNQKFVDINQKVYNDVKCFLNDKEVHINARVLIYLSTDEESIAHLRIYLS